MSDQNSLESKEISTGQPYSLRFDHLCAIPAPDMTVEETECLFETGEAMLHRLFGHRAEHFAKEICLEFFIRLRNNRVPREYPHKYFYNLAKTQVRQDAKPLYDQSRESVFPELDDSSDELLYRRDVIQKAMSKIPKHLHINFLYIVQYPESAHRVIKNQSVLDQYLLLTGLESVRKRFSKSGGHMEEVPDTQISQLSMLASIYKLSPELLMLFAAAKDHQSFFQVAHILSGKTVEFPEFSDLKETINQSVDLSVRIEQDNNSELSIRERETIAVTMTTIDSIDDLNSNVEILPFIDDYIAKVISDLAETHSRLQNRMVDALDVTNLDRVTGAYEALNREIRVQVKLISEIVATLTTLTEVKRAVKAVKAVGVVA